MLQHIDEQDRYIAGLTLGADPIVSGVAYASYFWSTLRGLAHLPNDVSNMTEPKRSVWNDNKELKNIDFILPVENVDDINFIKDNKMSEGEK